MSVPTAAERIAAVNERRERLKKEEAAAFAEQQANDLEALADLEATHGFDRVVRIDLNGWKPASGAATMIVVRVPLKSEDYFKRFEDTVSKPKSDNLKATTQLASACLVYPSDKDLLAATMELAPGILSNAGLQIIHAVQGRAEEEKKG
ncbi:MAG: hypothetical protein KBD62_35920 [Kofleriaceae bacterium]|nr:hypothetical protein [Kofleriaceae bacterium]